MPIHHRTQTRAQPLSCSKKTLNAILPAAVTSHLPLSFYPHLSRTYTWLRSSPCLGSKRDRYRRRGCRALILFVLFFLPYTHILALLFMRASFAPLYSVTFFSEHGALSPSFSLSAVSFPVRAHYLIFRWSSLSRSAMSNVKWPGLFWTRFTRHFARCPSNFRRIWEFVSRSDVARPMRCSFLRARCPNEKKSLGN